MTDATNTTTETIIESQIEVEIESPNGPRVLVTGEADPQTIEAELPAGWTVGENWHLGVRLSDGRMSYPLVQEDLGVEEEADSTARLARAAKHIDATDLGDGRWAHYADETSRWYVLEAAELESLCDYLDDEDPQISGDAYSHWCAGTASEEMPEGWEPGDEIPGEEAEGLSAADVARWTAELSFVTPPENQGQIVLVSYACDADYIYARSYDQSDRTTSVNVYQHPAEECDWAPWNGSPATGELVGSVDL